MTFRHLFLSLLLVVGCGLLVFSNSSVFAGQYDKLYGWAWSENIGWVSMNCYNQEIGQVCSPDYGVTYNFNDKKVTGAAWSEYGGWLCFGSTCTGWGSGNDPAGNAATASLKPSGLIEGWANWKVLGTDGWLKLLGPSTATAASYPWCRNCDTKGNCSLCFTDGAFAGSKNTCETCTGCSTGGVDHESCTTCTACYEYGVGVDYSNNTLVGWGWNGDTANHGFGWLQFHSTLTAPTTANPPYVSTQFGDIYGKEGVGSLQTGRPPVDKFSGTFMIQTDGKAIIHFNSCMAEKGGVAADCLNKGQLRSDGWVTEKVSLDFPNAANDYTNQFGLLDVEGMLAGHYGERIDIASFTEVPATLGGKVYYHDGDLTIADPKTFTNGTGTVRGAGTVVVRGNLTIQADLRYTGTQPANNALLASFGIIVIDDGSGTKGNIIIAPAATQLAGNIYAERSISTGSADAPLIVKGLMVTSQFNFQRYYADLNTKKPAESVIYDGRVLANPPPGFTSLTRFLPTWKSP